MHPSILLALLSVVALTQDGAALRPDPAIACGACDAWNAPRAPFRVFGNTYYVGVAGLSAVLITGAGGHILMDGGLPQSAALIADNIRAIGFKASDIRLILNSHAHDDHAGGLAALQRVSGATVAASAAGAAGLEAGDALPDDPQYGFGPGTNRFPRVAGVRRVTDGETLRVGDVAVTAHLTPGHTPGSTAWTWRACEPGRCLDIVYADSLNPVSAPGFRFSADATSPGRVDRFRRSIAAVAALPCDILLSVHPDFSNLDGRLERRRAGASPDPFVDPDACRAYAAAASRALDKRLAEER